MDLLLLTTDPAPASVLPAVGLLPVTVRSASPEVAPPVTAGPWDVLLLDARHDLVAARALCRLLGADGKPVSTLGVVTEGGMAAVGPDWGLSDVVLSCAGPAEVHARLRLLTARTTTSPRTGTIRLGGRLMMSHARSPVVTASRVIAASREAIVGQAQA